MSNIKVTSRKCISAANNSFNAYIRLNYHITVDSGLLSSERYLSRVPSHRVILILFFSRAINHNMLPEFSGHVAAVIRSHMNDLQPFETTIEQTTETMPLALKQ